MGNIKQGISLWVEDDPKGQGNDGRLICYYFANLLIQELFYRVHV